MATTSTLHANLMLAYRDRFSNAMPNEYFVGRPLLSAEIRSAPLEGPLIPENILSKLAELRKELFPFRPLAPPRKKIPKKPRGFPNRGRASRGGHHQASGKPSSAPQGQQQQSFRGGRGRRPFRPSGRSRRGGRGAPPPQNQQ